MACQCWQSASCLNRLTSYVQAVADCVDAEVPESVIRQVGENEYQAKLHELQVKVCASCIMNVLAAVDSIPPLHPDANPQSDEPAQRDATNRHQDPLRLGLLQPCCAARCYSLHAGERRNISLMQEVHEVLCDAAQEAMPYEQLDKLVNEDLLNQYIESR